MITIEEVRKSFPNPRAFRNACTTGYCIGGAFLMYLYGDTPENLAEDKRFPNEVAIRIGVDKINPTLDYQLMEAIVSDLVRHNDAGMFEASWNDLKELFRKREYNR